MRKRKDSSNTAGNVKEEVLHWNTTMDGNLIDVFVHQNEIGNRVGDTFTSKAYDCILSELSTKYPKKKIDKERIKNRIKYIKKGFGPSYDIFKNGLSGFSWDPLNSMWCAEPEVWDKLVELILMQLSGGTSPYIIMKNWCVCMVMIVQSEKKLKHLQMKALHYSIGNLKVVLQHILDNVKVILPTKS